MEGVTVAQSRVLALRDQWILLSAHRPVFAEADRRIRRAPDFAAAVKHGDPDQVVFLAVVNHANGIAITFAENMERKSGIELRKHGASKVPAKP